MKWFMNRKVGTKQILAFSAVLLVTVFLGIFSLLKLVAIRATTVDLSDRRVPAIQSLSELQTGAMQYRVSEMSFVFLNDPDERALRADNMKAGMETVAKAEADFEPLIETPEERKTYETIVQDVEQCKAASRTILDFVQKNDGADATSEVLGNAAGVFSQLMSDVQAEVDLKVQGAAKAKLKSAALYRRSVWWISGGLVLAAVLSLVLALATTRSIANPVRNVGTVVSRIASGDITSEDLALDSSDELGELAQNVNLMRKNLGEMIISVSMSAERIAIASEEFTSTNQRITSNSVEASEQASAVSAATDHLKHNLETVATGTEQMSVTIQDIARNAAESARVASEAVKTAEITNGVVSKLGESSAEIGQVVKVITGIARQTNLLALNATIEAARAGDAGKGFAVVANEVKELAKQTTKATEDISQKVTAIQSDTKDCVSAIATIGAIIDQVNGIAGTIASAVEQQSAATDKISRNLSEAARGSLEIAQNIGGLAQTARSTMSGAEGSQKAAGELARMSTELHGLVSKFNFHSNSGGMSVAGNSPTS